MIVDSSIYEEQINKRLIRVLNNPELYSYCLKAYTQSNITTGFENPEAVAKLVLDGLSQSTLLLEKEKMIWKEIGGLVVKGEALRDHVDTIVFNRVEKMYEQIGQYILDKGKAADYGAGWGDFLRFVRRKKPNIDIEGWDIVSDDTEGDVEPYDGNRIPRDDQYYDQVWQTTVLHHFDDPITGVKEIARIAKKRIILLETLPLGWLDDKEKDYDLTFVADYYYRLLLKSNEPVPGSYHSKDEWVQLFEKEGWKCINSEIFGNDIDFAEFSHVRIVLERA